jgi:beta-lactam-binding protein with PASTA domain
MTRILLVAAVVAVAVLAVTLAWAVPPPGEPPTPKVHDVDVATDVAYDGDANALIFTFTTEKHGSSEPDVDVIVTPTPEGGYTVDTQLVGDFYVTTVTVEIEAPDTSATEFTVDYSITTTAGKSKQSFLGEASETASVDDFIAA